MRVILHADLNNFFASVELLKFPELRTQPVIIAGSRSRRHGVVLAKNEAAKACGVKTAETLSEALQKCPDAHVLPPHHEEYRLYSRRVRALFRELTERFESFGIDEGWLDITETEALRRAAERVPTGLFARSRRAVEQHWQRPLEEDETENLRRLIAGKEVADALRERVKRELQLSISVGISYNKVFAKLGSDLKKPDASTLITPWNAPSLMRGLPASRLLYVGRVTEEKLRSRGILSIQDLAEAEDEVLLHLLGKNGLMLKRYARGEDDSPVLTAEERGPSKSIGNSTTLAKDISRYEEVERVFRELAEEVSERAEAEKRTGETVRIWMRDMDFEDRSRQKTLPRPTRRAEDLLRAAMELFREQYEFKKPLRALGLSLNKLNDPEETEAQITLSEYHEQRRGEVRHAKVSKQVEALRRRFGDQILLGSELAEKQESSEGE